MRYQVGDLLLFGPILWTITRKNTNCPLRLETGHRVINLYMYEIDRLLKSDKNNKHYPIIK